VAWTNVRSAIAVEHHRAAARGEVPDPRRLADLKRQLKAERAADYLQRMLRTDPALEAAQLSRLANLLTTAAAQAGGDHAAA
jgi:hypothetical protein